MDANPDNSRKLISLRLAANDARWLALWEWLLETSTSQDEYEQFSDRDPLVLNDEDNDGPGGD